MKLKSHSGVKKRVKITGTGKILFQKASKRHLMINKSKRQKKLNSSGQEVHSTDDRRIKRLIPMSF